MMQAHKHVNSDVAAELRLKGKMQKVIVNVLNNKVDAFETMPVEVKLESLDGKTHMKIQAFIANCVTGDMTTVNWKVIAKKWNHLKDIKFPYVGPRPITDMLIGIDYADLHCSLSVIRGKPGEPIAHLTPLEWTCVGNPKEGRSSLHQTNFIGTYFMQNILKWRTSTKFGEILGQNAKSALTFKHT